LESYLKIDAHYPPIFNGEKLIIYNFISSVPIEGRHSVNITAKTGEQVHRWAVPLDLSQDRIEGSLIHRLTAKQFIKSLEHKPEQNKTQIVDIATSWGLVSKYSSFVAVEERDYQWEASSGLQSINIKKQMELKKNRKS